MCLLETTMAEAASVTTFVMGARLPWPDDAPAMADNGPFEAGVIHDGGSRQTCAIRRISPLGATLRGKTGKAPGDEIAVELATGHRHAAQIDWIEGGEIGIRFHSAIDVLALINRKLVSQPAERRAMPRVEVRCGAFIKKGEDFLPVTVRNISAGGLQVEGDALPPQGTFVSIFVEGLIVPAGEIAWRKDRLAGIELLEELSWTSIMPWVRELVRAEA
jgi:hypothetical protein